MTTFYIKLNGDIIVDILEYAYPEFIEVQLELPLPSGFYGGWYRWDGTDYHFDQSLYDESNSVNESDNHA
jgi:hypothetical protein